MAQHASPRQVAKTDPVGLENGRQDNTVANQQTGHGVSPKRDIRLVLLDMDGTLLNRQYCISERNAYAVQRAL